MLNNRLTSIDLYKDIMVKNNARIARKLGLPVSKVLELAQKSTRDNARTPMQWSDAEYAGFSTATPWFYVNSNYKEINVESQLDDPDSLLNFYRSALLFRRDNPLVIYGRYKEYYPESKELYVYERSYDERRLLVVCSFTEEPVRFDAPADYELEKGKRVFSNYEENYIISNGFTTRPYEMRVYLF